MKYYLHPEYAPIRVLDDANAFVYSYSLGAWQIWLWYKNNKYRQQMLESAARVPDTLSIMLGYNRE